MIKELFQLNLGLSQYVLTAYTSLVAEHPVNGSQLSRNSGIPRARIYDVLRTLKAKKFVVESGKGMYTPIPPEELIRRLREDHEAGLLVLEKRLKEVKKETEGDVIWALNGHTAAMGKAGSMIREAENEIYVRISPEEGELLDPILKEAEERGVMIKYIAMEPVPLMFKYQVIHPAPLPGEAHPETRFFDIVVDRREILCGVFIRGEEETATINWGSNRNFVLAGRDSLRHDFFHYFLHRIQNEKKSLTREEEELYSFILKDI